MATTEASAEDDENLSDPLLDQRRYASNKTSQVAIIGTNLCPIESLEYEMMENGFFKQDWRSRGRRYIVLYVILKWSLCLLIGVLTGAVGLLTNLAIENLAGLKPLRTSDLMLANKYLMAFGAVVIPNFVRAMLAVIITSYIALAAAGSGIPELVCRL